ncbi:MAG: hypothetical protein ACYC2U_08250 [Candidatus Amoebophilus sp.]
MQAILTKALKTGNKVIVGTVLQDSFSHITLVVTDDKGQRKTKKFKKQDWVIKLK